MSTLHYCIVFLTVLALSPAHAASQTCAVPTRIESVGGCCNFLGAFGDVSADGSAVVGYATDANEADRAFRWTQSGGTQNLGTLPGFASSFASGVSADGSVVVGSSNAPNGLSPRAFLWTAGGGMQDFGAQLGFSHSDATGVSDDGDVVVGNVGDGALDQAFRWSAAGGLQLMATPPGFAGASALNVSPDGAVVVGSLFGNGLRAFRWTIGAGVEDLGVLPGFSNSRAMGASANGSVVVGTCSSGFGGPSRGFRWTAATGMQSTGTLAQANAVSADGRVVVGMRLGAAARWTVGGDVEDLGLAMRAVGCSADGSVVVGGDLVSGGWRLQSSVLGDTYCHPAVPNSAGCGGIVLASENPRLATGSLDLTAALLPRFSLGIFLASQTQGFSAEPGGSEGNLCLDGSVGRFVGPGQIMNSETGWLVARRRSERDCDAQWTGCGAGRGDLELPGVASRRGGRQRHVQLHRRRLDHVPAVTRQASAVLLP